MLAVTLKAVTPARQDAEELLPALPPLICGRRSLKGAVVVDVTSLLRRVQEGDERAFEELVGQYTEKALRTAYLLTGRRDIAEDAVQEAFVRCYRSVGGLRDPAAFEAWFYRLLARICWRLAAREKGLVSLESASAGGQEGVLADFSAGDAFEAEETRGLVRQALGRLNALLRTVVVLRYYNGLSIKETAEVLGCPEGTVKSRLHAAHRQLGAELRLIAPETFGGDQGGIEKADTSGKAGEPGDA